MQLSRTAKVVSATAAGAAVGLGAAGVGLAAHFARVSVTVDRGPERPVRVVAVEAGDDGAPARVWLTGGGAAAEGVHVLLFDEPGDTRSVDSGALPPGRVRLGRVMARSGGRVLRPIVQLDAGELQPECRGRMVGWWYADAAELGYRVEEVSYESEVGPMSAWVVRPRFARKRRWAVHVHGRGADPAETFRGIAPFARAGVTSLIISYRNDRGAPAGLNGRYGMGISESRDVDAAVAWARAHGAERVTLVGYSMGGTASLVSLARGAHRDVIDGVVLDSPGLDWPEILADQATAHRVPRWIATLGSALLERGVVASGETPGVAISALTPERLAAALEVPVLVLASPNDRFVSWAGARKLASLRPDLVQLVRFAGAGHVRLWNTDPERWEQHVLGFVRALPRPGWRGQ